MSEDVLELQNEVETLSKRIEILEKRDNRRRSLGYIKLVIKLLLIIAFVFGIWRGYQYVVNEIPNMMEDKINSLNPFKKN